LKKKIKFGRPLHTNQFTHGAAAQLYVRTCI
jgi:hypothetical protein